MATRTLAPVVSQSKSAVVVSISKASPEPITQNELALLLSLRGRLKQLEEQVASAEQSMRQRLDDRAAVEAGDHTAKLETGFRRDVSWKSVTERLAYRFKLDGEAYVARVLAATGPHPSFPSESISFQNARADPFLSARASSKTDRIHKGGWHGCFGVFVAKSKSAIKKRARPTAPKLSHLSPAELLALLKAARARSARDWCMVLLAYRHGLRASEVCGLRMGDVDQKAGAVTVARLKGSMLTVQPLYAHRGQPLLDEPAAMRAWLREREADGSDYLFTSQKGGKLHRSAFFRAFQVIAASAGLPVELRHPHVLKHSLASHLVAGNVNLALVKQALGHRSITSTMQYISTSDGQAAEAAGAALMALF